MQNVLHECFIRVFMEIPSVDVNLCMMTESFTQWNAVLHTTRGFFLMLNINICLDGTLYNNEVLQM